MFIGAGRDKIASIFKGSMQMPSFETMNPSNRPVSTQKKNVEVKMDFKMTTFEKNGPQMFYVQVPLLGMSRKVIKIGFHNMFNVMKSI